MPPPPLNWLQATGRRAMQIIDGVLGISRTVANAPYAAFSIGPWSKVQQSLTAPAPGSVVIGWEILLSDAMGQPSAAGKRAVDLQVHSVAVSGMGTGTVQVTKTPVNNLDIKNFLVTPGQGTQRFSNTIQQTTNDQVVGDLQFYDRETERVFFSRTQLQLVQESYYGSSDCLLFLTGYELYTGRVSTQTAMAEYRDLNVSRGKNDPTHWFTLKMEVVPETEVQMTGGSSAPGRGVSISLSNCPGSSPEPTPLQTSLIAVASGGGGLPVSHYAQPCPPEWDYIGAMVAATRGVTKPPLTAQDTLCLIAQLQNPTAP